MSAAPLTLAPTSSLPAVPTSPRPSAVTSEHCAFCFDAILAHCGVDVPLPLADVTSRERFPLFITWKKRSASAVPVSQQPAASSHSLAAMASKMLPAFFSSSASPASASFTATSSTTATSHGATTVSATTTATTTSVVLYPASSYRLRGCIGTFSPRPLPAGLREYAITSAFRDHRFAPIAAHELPLLSLSVSLLTDFTPCQRWDDWHVGTHGITLDWRGVSATYLPEVALEQGWSKEDTMEELARKGGYSGDVGEAERREMRIVRYESQKGHMSYEEYLRWKEDEAKQRTAKAAGGRGSGSGVTGSGSGNVLDRSDVARTKRTIGKRSRLEDDEDEDEESAEVEEDGDGVEDGE